MRLLGEVILSPFLMGSHEFHRREVGAGRSVALVDDVFYQVGGLFDVQFSHNVRMLIDRRSAISLLETSSATSFKTSCSRIVRISDDNIACPPYDVSR